jgi:hypothetical protein
MILVRVLRGGFADTRDGLGDATLRRHAMTVGLKHMLGSPAERLQSSSVGESQRTGLFPAAGPCGKRRAAPWRRAKDARPCIRPPFRRAHLAARGGGNARTSDV